MENLLKDFNIPAKDPSEEAQRRWRSAVAVVRNRPRRFRMVADLARRSAARTKILETQDRSLSSWCCGLLASLYITPNFLSVFFGNQSKTDPGSSYATRCWDVLPYDVQWDVISKLPPESQMLLRLTSKKILTLTWTDYHPYRPISDLPLVVNLVTLSLFMEPRVKVFETLSLLRKKSRTDNMEAKYLQVFATSACECFSRGVKYIYSFTGEKVEKMIAQGGVVDDADPEIVSAPPMNEGTHDSSVWMEYISSPKE